MAFVDYINPEQRGTAFSHFSLRPTELVTHPAPPLHNAGFPQVSRPPPHQPTVLPPYQPTYCPRCYSHINTGYSVNGVCPNCNCTLPTMPGPPHPPHGATLPIGPIVRPPPPHSFPKVSNMVQVPHSHKNHHQHPNRQDVHDLNVDRFMMSSMLHVVNDVLDEPKSPRLGDQPAHPIIESSFPSLSTSITIDTTTTVMSNSSPKSNLCQCGGNHVAFCINCQEFLCVGCVQTHEQASADHQIITTPTSSLPNSRKTTPPSASSVITQSSTSTTTTANEVVPVFEEEDYQNCERHSNEKQKYYCQVCVAVMCKSCALNEHTHHKYMTLQEAYMQFKPSLKDLLGKTQVEINMLDYSCVEAKSMTDRVIEKQQEAIKEAQQIFQAHRDALAQREQEIIAQINTIAKLRMDSLLKEKESIEGALKSLRSLSSQADSAINDSNHGQMLVTHFQLSDKLQNCRPYALNSNPSEDDSFMLKSNTTAAQNALKSLCLFTTAPYPPLCTAMGEGLYHPRVNRLCTVVLCTKDRAGEPCLEGGERLFVQLKSIINGTSGTLPVDTRDNLNGSYSINFRPRQKGEHQLVIAIRGQHIQGSPFTLLVDGGREYGRFGVVTQVFGSEGSQNGQFCRPWGICCDQQGNIIVGDRSNHRVQVFDLNGVFKHKFGTEGVRPGQFNRPAGVAVTREGHIVVADKDNHRIQVVKLDGTFLFMFGSKGGNDGQMIYPYDVAVNQLDGRIAVTDTGNHRLLIFSHDGILLGKFGYKGYLCGHFDSPRGIAFNDDGHIIVSDFNVHHILVIHPDGTTARILGSQGSGNSQFMRPQGITVDHMGNFVVADTRNNRVVIMHPGGQFIAKFGGPGQAHGQFDRPTSVAVLPDGRIAVVDFGNARIQIF